MPFAESVNFVQVTPWPAKGVAAFGSTTDVEQPTTTASRRELAAGVYVLVVAYDVAAVVEKIDARNVVTGIAIG